MRLVDAERELARRLVFGDEAQIAAARYIMAVRACIEAADACQHEAYFRCSKCSGAGTITCVCLECDHQHTRTCPACNGEGKVVTGGVNCFECMAPFDHDVIQEAARQVAKR